MGHISKDLLHLEHKDDSTSSIESALLVCNKKESHSQLKKPNPDEKPVFDPLPQSQVLGRVKDFLGMMSEANKRLELDAKDKAQDYDIEVLTGTESEVIEMDLMLGIADLHTPEAVAAAESAIACNQPAIPLADSNSGTESEDSGDDSDDDDSENDDVNEENENCSPVKLKRSKASKNESEAAGNKKSRKRPKIVEIS